MPPTKKPRLDDNADDVFVVTSETTADQVPKDVRVARIPLPVRGLSNNIFVDCHSLMEVTFEEGIAELPWIGLKGCQSLTTVKLPLSLRKIDDRFFERCERLTSIELPRRLETIGRETFANSGIRHVKFPHSLTTIENWAFSGCSQLKSVFISPTLRSISFKLFHFCTELEQVVIRGTARIYQIEDSAFEECRALKKLDLSRCTECYWIANRAFASCRSLSWIALPPNLRGSIETDLFVHCSALRHLRVPSKVDSIGKSDRECFPFHGCTSLLSLEVPEGLERITLFPTDDDALFVEGVFMFPSMVNMYLPPCFEVPDWSFQYPISEGNQFSKITENWGDLFTKLMRRFDDLPLHKLCYFHSYHPMEAVVRQINSIVLDNDQKSAVVTQTDAFGMTPLHILALAHTPRLELLRELVTSVDFPLTAKDRFGSTPLDYLGMNPSNAGLKVTRWLMKKVVQERGAYLGLDRWRQELLVLLEGGVRQADCMSTMNRGVQSLLVRLQTLEFLEVLSLLELVLWRIKLIENPTDRESCRVHCGISILVENILPLLGK
ncbi:MAG: hypothetical protein SGBAC_003048 [Bacillariaceae sp.]